MQKTENIIVQNEHAWHSTFNQTNTTKAVSGLNWQFLRTMRNKILNNENFWDRRQKHLANADFTTIPATRWTTGTKYWSVVFPSAYPLNAMTIEKVWIVTNARAMIAAIVRPKIVRKNGKEKKNWNIFQLISIPSE